jgi:hypothetical protein
MRDDADETQRPCPGVPITVGLIGGNVQRHSRLHNDLPSRTVGDTLTFHHKDLVLKRMLVNVKDSSWLELDHAHRKVGRSLGPSDDPTNGFVLANRLSGHFSIVYA